MPSKEETGKFQNKGSSDIAKDSSQNEGSKESNLNKSDIITCLINIANKLETEAFEEGGLCSRQYTKELKNLAKNLITVPRKKEYSLKQLPQSEQDKLKTFNLSKISTSHIFNQKVKTDILNIIKSLPTLKSIDDLESGIMSTALQNHDKSKLTALKFMYFCIGTIICGLLNFIPIVGNALAVIYAIALIHRSRHVIMGFLTRKGLSNPITGYITLKAISQRNNLSKNSNFSRFSRLFDGFCEMIVIGFPLKFIEAYNEFLKKDTDPMLLIDFAPKTNSNSNIGKRKQSKNKASMTKKPTPVTPLAPNTHKGNVSTSKNTKVKSHKKAAHHHTRPSTGPAPSV